MSKPTEPAPDQIKEMEPEQLLKQYDRLIWKMVNQFQPNLAKYAWIDEQDLYQVACIALLEAQTSFNPDDKIAFMTIACNRIRWLIFRTLKIKWSPAGETLTEPQTVSLDEPINEDGDITRGDLLQSDDEPLEERAERADTAVRVREAVRALPDNEKEVIERIYLNDPTETRADIARSKGCSGSLIGLRERKAFRKLEIKLKPLRTELPHHIGLNHFNSHWTSEPEQYVLVKERRRDQWRVECAKYIQERTEKHEKETV